jgi:hypothetical protein
MGVRAPVPAPKHGPHDSWHITGPPPPPPPPPVPLAFISESELREYDPFREFMPAVESCARRMGERILEILAGEAK